MSVWKRRDFLSFRSQPIMASIYETTTEEPIMPIAGKIVTAGIAAALVLMTSGCRRPGSTSLGKPENPIRVRQSGAGAAEISLNGSAWQPAHPGSRLSDGSVVRAVTEGVAPGLVLERESDASGEFLYARADGSTIHIRKSLGAAGRQLAPAPIVQYPKEFWDKLSQAESDILAEKLFSESREDPTFRQIQGIFPRLAKPEACIGRIEDPSEITVAADGSVSMDSGFFSGSEYLGNMIYSPFLRFRLNGRLVTLEESESVVSRGLLHGWLPATEFTYLQPDTQSGWEELVFTGLHEGRKSVFIRFRVGNFSTAPRTVDFALEGPDMGGSLDLRGAGITVVTPLRTGHTFDYPRRQKLQQEALHRLQSPLRIPLSANRPYSAAAGRAGWSLHLDAGQTEDLYFFLPGGDDNGPSTATLPADKIAPAFYAALENEYNVWSRFIASGSEISLPEPGLEDVFNAALIQTMVAVDGDEPRGGFTHYEGYWPFCTMHQIRLMLDTGHPDYAKRYLADLMKYRIRDDGRFWFDEYQQQYQVSDAGDFLAVLSRYYWQTGDASFITDFQERTGRVIDMIRRERAVSLKKFPADNPRHGMIPGSIENDVPDPDYLYTNNAPVWAGLRDYARALGDIAVTNGDAGLAREAKTLADEATEFHGRLRASFEKYDLERDAEGKPYFFNIAPNDDGKASRYRTNHRYNIYRRFQCQPRTMATDFLTDDEIRGFYKFQSEHDSTILGVRRWEPDVIDDFVSFDCDFQRSRLGMSREYLMKFFAYLQCLSGNGTWTAFEEVDSRPTEGLSGRVFSRFKQVNFLNGYDGQHATSAIAKMARDIFAVDQPGGGIVWLGGAVSRNWLATGKPITAKKLGTRYGCVDLSLSYDAEARATTVEIAVEPGRAVPEIRVRLRDPQGGKAMGVTKGAAQLTQDLEWAVLRNVSGSVRFTVSFKS